MLPVICHGRYLVPKYPCSPTLHCILNTILRDLVCSGRWFIYYPNSHDLQITATTSLPNLSRLAKQVTDRFPCISKRFAQCHWTYDLARHPTFRFPRHARLHSEDATIVRLVCRASMADRDIEAW